jgi:hypothetical protein
MFIFLEMKLKILVSRVDTDPDGKPPGFPRRSKAPPGEVLII